VTAIGLALLSLVIVGIWSSCRVAADADQVMSAWQRRAIMRERRANNPRLK
jgi:hypothetical protein